MRRRAGEKNVTSQDPVNLTGRVLVRLILSKQIVISKVTQGGAQGVRHRKLRMSGLSLPSLKSMNANPDTAVLTDFSWNPPIESWSHARFQVRLFAIVTWFGVCGIMLSALVGVERFLLLELSLGTATALSVALCVLGVFCAVGGSFSTIRLLLLRSRLRPRM